MWQGHMQLLVLRAEAKRLWLVLNTDFHLISIMAEFLSVLSFKEIKDYLLCKNQVQRHI